MTDQELITVLKNIIMQNTEVGDAELIGTVAESGLVRVVVNTRGGYSFLLSKDGGVLQYIMPNVNHEDAVQAFKNGKRSKISDAALNAAGYRRA